MNNENLNTMLFSYRNGSITKKKIIEAISLFVYKFPHNKYSWKEDDCSEFFCYFYPKISKIIDSFKIAEAPFEAYLVKTLKLQIKTFAAKKITEEINRKIFKNREFWPYDDYQLYCAESGIDFYIKDPQPSYSLIKKIISSDKTKPIPRKETLNKRIILFVLKNMNNIKETEIPAIAEILDYDKKWLSEAFSKIKQIIEKKIKRKKLFEERRNRHFCRLYHLHELLSKSETAEEKESIYLEILKLKAYINNLANKIDQTITEPSHKDIAEIMNIPKGSVDSGLFYFKLYLGYLENN